ncbi:uncharacterized protein LOC125492543 [Beta vulgaris subsp. vulgaris]|uniref:uncharacterized protein LOC125492543 n=1 Tax=Beta vulgaris subsp. vulgaris TaxID=3555 RepID=UPI002546E12C|nr:uncharacterized protein LOC125492543 [Beta vulgaris subsp. vulgaris]
MQRQYEQMRAEMLEMKQANERLATDFTTSQEKIQKLQEELASSKASKIRRRTNLNDIPYMRDFSESDENEPENDGEPEDKEPLNNEENDQGKGEANLMAKHMIQIEKQNRRLMKLMSQVPGPPTPSIVEHPDGYAESPFIERIVRAVLPKKLNLPTLAANYDGSTDPGEHVAQYKQRMWQVSIPSHLVEACMCKSFGATLTGPALKWLGSIKPGSIDNFSTLVNKKGLILQPKLYNRLTKYPCQTFEEVKSRALAQMRLEEDDAILNTISTRRTPENPNDRKAFVPKKNNWRNHPYSCSNQVNNVTDIVDSAGNDARTESPVFPDIDSYGFSVDVGGVVNALTKIGAPVRWLKKSDRPESQKDQTKWCQFHHDHGHKTEQCIALRREVAFMLNKGQLKDLLSDKGKASFERNPAQSDPPASPTHVKVININSGGSDVYGLTYSEAKRLAREGTPSSAVFKSCRSAEERKLEAMAITFDDDDVCDVEHHDGLVISLTVSNYLLKRVLVDEGATYQRLVNQMFKDQLGDTIGVHIDDMLVKSKQASNHIQHLSEAFDVCEGKFLGYVVTQRGIEAYPDQIKALLNI